MLPFNKHHHSLVATIQQTVNLVQLKLTLTYTVSVSQSDRTCPTSLPYEKQLTPHQARAIKLFTHHSLPAAILDQLSNRF